MSREAVVATIAISRVVDAAVRTGVIASSPQAREQFSDMCRRSPNSAWAALLHALPTPKPAAAAATLAVAVEDDSAQYPSHWTPSRAQTLPSGVRTARLSGSEPQAKVATESTRADSLIQAARKAAAAVQRTSQERRTGYNDSHDLIASDAATRNAERLTAMREADQRRVSAEQAKRFGR